MIEMKNQIRLNNNSILSLDPATKKKGVSVSDVTLINKSLAPFFIFLLREFKNPVQCYTFSHSINLLLSHLPWKSYHLSWTNPEKHSKQTQKTKLYLCIIFCFITIGKFSLKKYKDLLNQNTFTRRKLRNIKNFFWNRTYVFSREIYN